MRIVLDGIILAVSYFEIACLETKPFSNRLKASIEIFSFTLAWRNRLAKISISFNIFITLTISVDKGTKKYVMSTAFPQLNKVH